MVGELSVTVSCYLDLAPFGRNRTLPSGDSRMVISNKHTSLVYLDFLLVTHKHRFTKFRSYQLIWDLSSINLNDSFSMNLISIQISYL